jgi:hypothetical protein
LGAKAWLRPNRIAVWSACAVTTCGAPCSAAASGSTYRLQVVRAEGAGSCPSALVIERDVSQRLHRRPFSDASERSIDVVLERGDGKWLAKLYLRVEPSDSDAVRSIESDAADCAELGKAVALAVALAIAPELPAEPEPQPKPQVACPPARVVPPPPKASLHGAASLRLLFSPNLLPHRSFGSALSVSLHGDLVGANFGGFFYPESELRQAGAHLGFGVSAAFASGCLWARTKEPQVWSCIGARVGALHSVVYAPEPERPGDHVWWAAYSELGLRQQLLGRLFVDVGVAAVFPLLRQRFEVEASPPAGATGTPTVTRLVYEQGPAVVEGFLGLGLHLD